MIIEKRLEELGIQLYQGTNPLGSYVPFVRTGNLVYISGQGPAILGVYETHLGKVGVDISIGEAYKAAQITANNMVAVLKNAVGDLDKVVRIVSVHGFVNSAPDFYQQPLVINGASDRLVEIFGEKGKHSRCAMSVASLPLNMCVEVEMIAEVLE